jgi:hypothetical protein
VLEDFEIGGDTITGEKLSGGPYIFYNHVVNPASWGKDFSLTIDTKEFVSGKQSLRFEGTPSANYAGMQLSFYDRLSKASFSLDDFLAKYKSVKLKDKGVEPKDLSAYTKLTLQFRPSIDMPPQSVAFRITTADGERTDYIYPESQDPIFANQWVKMSFDLTKIADRKGVTVVRFYPALIVTDKWAYNIDDLAVE